MKAEIINHNYIKLVAENDADGALLRLWAGEHGRHWFCYVSGIVFGTDMLSIEKLGIRIEEDKVYDSE